MRYRLAVLSLVALAALTGIAQAHHTASSGGPATPTFTTASAIPAKAPPARSLASATGNDRRYALANGCYSFRARSNGNYLASAGRRVTAGAASLGTAEPFRMQATALGKYLLYTRDRKFLANDRGIRLVSRPSNKAIWRVDVTPGNGFRLSQPGARAALAVAHGGRAAAASGRGDVFTAQATARCAVFPEVETGASGKPLTSKTSWGEVRGMIDLHMHQMAFEFLGGKAHCGRPWSPLGAPDALKDCVDHEATGGCGAVLENVLYGNPARCHDPGGWPTFKGWPDPKSLTHEQSYYKWMERAYMGGLRVFVNLFVENKVLCELYPLKQNSCNEMNSVRLQNRDIEALENYIDAQNGGPGRGWYRIVKDPFEARRVIAQGKLAVVKGIEVSEPFDCAIYNDQPKCDKAGLERGLNEVYGFGVRQMELINKFDNALAGVAGDNGETGVVVNSGNRLETGKYWEMQACEGPKDEEDKEQIGVYKHDEQDIGSNLLESFVPQGAAPVYPEGSSCNARGLSELGDYAVKGLMKRGMVIDPDHLSVRARKNVLDITEAARYSGVVSSHSWSTPDVESRIYNLGGVITPMQDDAASWVKHWKETKAKAKPNKFFFGYGYGADQNGFATQFGPRNGPNPVQYPFKSFDGGVTFQRQKSGQRIFDLNKDGMANYGLFADWWQDIRNVGGKQAQDDMARGAEAYLQMWERANGISHGCKSGREHFTRRGLGRLYLRNSAAQLLRRGGQPQSRGNRVWRWCALRKKNRRRKVVAALDKKGRVQLVGSNAIGHRGLRIRVGVKSKRLRGKARKFGKNVFVRKAGKRARFVYGVRKGRVRYVAVVTRGASKSRKQLKRYLKLAGLR